MSFPLTDDHRGAIRRNQKNRTVNWQATRRLWSGLRPRLISGMPIVLGVAALGLLGMAWHLTRVNSVIHALRTNHDIAIGDNAPPEALLARIEFLLAHDRADEIQPYVEAIDKAGPDKLRAVAHYNFANGRLRQAFDLITDGKLDPAGPLVVLSRQEYRRALYFAPDYWDAKFNLDVASRLIRDFPAFERTIGDAVKTDPKKIWTDIPGKPEGLP